MTPETGFDRRCTYIEERHKELRADYCGLDGNSGFKKDVQLALFRLQEEGAERDGYAKGNNDMLKKIIGLLTFAILFLGFMFAYFAIRPSHSGAIGMNTNSVVATESGIRDTSR